MQGINHNEFDNIIENLFQTCFYDLKSVGIVDSKISRSDYLIRKAMITFALSSIDINNSEMYYNSYLLQKDKLRHMQEYISE